MNECKNLKNWIKIQQIFDRTFSHQILKEFFKYRILFFVSLLFTLSMCAVLLLSDELMDKLFFPMLLSLIIVGLAFTNWMHQSLFKKYGLLDLPFHRRFDLLHYMLFIKELSKSGTWQKEILVNLISWQEVSEKRIETLKTFNSTKWVAFAVIGSISALFAAQGFNLKMNMVNFSMSVALIFTLYIFSYGIYDGFLSYRKRDYCICRFLKMYLMEFE